MKYILGFIGMVIGQIVGMLVADSRVINWVLGLIIAIVFYQVPAFIRYTRATPQQLLSFHGPNAPISRSASVGELKAFISQLYDGGLILYFHPKQSDVKIDSAQWGDLIESNKLTFFQVLARAQVIDGAAPPEIRLFDGQGAFLAKYSTADGIIYSEKFSR